MMQKQIAIIDYDLGNLHSINQAMKAAGAEAVVIDNYKQLANFDSVILPGVGAFSQAVAKLKSSGFWDAVLEHVQKRRPLMGICLGLQLLFDASEEFGRCEGLGLLPGTVKKFPECYADKIVRIPQIGWNVVREPQWNKWSDNVFRDTAKGEYFYFVHSYYADLADRAFSMAEASYGGVNYACAVKRESIVAFQFHPEKSGTAGIKLLKNWIETC